MSAPTHETMTFPLEAFLAPRKMGEQISLALDHVIFLVLFEIIVARDVMTGETRAVYGSHELELANRGEAICGLQILIVELDLESTDLTTCWRSSEQ